jgi:hypothetical protein
MAQAGIYDRNDEYEGERRGSLWGRGVAKFKELSNGYNKRGQAQGPLDTTSDPDYNFLKFNIPTTEKETILNNSMGKINNAIRLSVDGNPRKTYSGQ